MVRLPDYHPDKPFDGLGFRGWCRVIFRSRAATVKQCDTVTLDLFQRLNAETARADELARALPKLTSHVIQCHAAIDAAYTHLCTTQWPDADKAAVVYRLLVDVTEAGKQPL